MGRKISCLYGHNRQLTTNKDLALAGTIESALIELSKTTGAENPYTSLLAEFPATGAQASSTAVFPEAAEGSVAYGTPGWIRQADILRAIAPVLSVRDDTFLIRAYGDVKDASGNITAKSWCEAVVQRKAEYVDPSDKSTEYTNISSAINTKYGRKFHIISFRWLSEDEI